MTDKQKALIIIIIASLFWSSAGLSKILIRDLGPYFSGFIRFFIASIAIVPFLAKEKITAKHIREFLPVTLAGTANVVLYFMGLQTSTASAAVLIYAGVPLITAIMAKVFLGELLSFYKILGFVIGILGICYITFLPAWEKGSVATGTFPGNVYFLIAIFTWSMYIAGSRYLINVKKYSPISVSGVSFLTSCVVFFILSLFTFHISYLTLLFRPINILLALHIGIFVTVIPFLLLQWALTKTSASTAALSNYLQPVFGLFINALVLGEVLSPHLLVGALVIFTGIAITSGVIRVFDTHPLS